MSDSAKNTWNVATTTPRYSTTNRVLQERLSAVNSALMGSQHTPSNPEDERGIKAWHVELLAEGGYNYVWLVTYQASYEVCTVSLLSTYSSCCPKVSPLRDHSSPGRQQPEQGIDESENTCA